SKTLELKPDHGPAARARGLAHGALGQWNQAEHDLKRAIEAHEASPAVWSHFAILRLHLMDVEGYRLVCRVMRMQFTRPPHAVEFGRALGSYGVFHRDDPNKPVGPRHSRSRGLDLLAGTQRGDGVWPGERAQSVLRVRRVLRDGCGPRRAGRLHGARPAGAAS